MSEEYQIEGNITEISNCLKNAGVCSFTFVPEQNYTVTVDGQRRAVFVSADTQNARQLAYDQKLVCDISGVSLPNLTLGKITVTFEKKTANDADIKVTIKSDLENQNTMQDLQIIKYGIKL